MAKRPVTTRISINVKPPALLRRAKALWGLSWIEVLGNLIDRSDDGDRDETDDETHENHQDRLNGA